MVEAGRVKLDELHVGNGRAGAVRHRDPIAGGDVGIRRVEINLAAATGGQRDPWRSERLYLPGLVVQRVNPGTAVVLRLARLGRGDEVDGEVILEHGDIFVCADCGQQRAFDLAAGDVFGVQDAAFRVPSLPAKIEFAVTVTLTFGELHAELDQFLDAGRAFLDNAAHDLLIAQPSSGGKGVAHVALERVLLACDGGDAALCVVGVGLGPAFLRDDRDGAGVGDLESKRQPGDAAAQHQKIKLLRGIRHPHGKVFGHRRPLSMRRVEPKNTARAKCVPRPTCLAGASVLGSKNSM